MKIFLDPGHNYSGIDTGACGNGLREQDITFKIADLVRKKLTALGVEVAMSRNKITDNLGKNVNDSLVIRARMSDNFGANFCVSIHCNSGGGTGVEVYAYRPGGMGEKLANAVDSNIVKNLKLANGGVKFANFYMLRKPKAPAILVETAFIDNKNDAELLENRQIDFANAIVQGICDVTGIENNLKGGNKVMIDNVNQAIEKLVAVGVINSPDYWQNAIGIVNNLDKLIINVANKL